MGPSSRQYSISDLLGITALLAVVLYLVPVALIPAMGFLWIPIGLALAFTAGLLLAGRQGAKRAVLGAVMILIVAFMLIATLYVLAWGIYLSNAR